VDKEIAMPGKKSAGKHDTGETRATRGTGREGAAPVAPFDQRTIEKQMAAVARLLEEQEFESIEEAEAFLQATLASGELPTPAPATPLEQAQDVVYQALEATGKRRLDLARKALTISADCADAYVLLAESTTDIQEARRLYEQGVQAGERALGAEVFDEVAGEFWDLIETRPYMRARHRLAEVQWRLGEREAAIGHARGLLRLNPGDNQGIRYLLATWLLAVGDDAGLESLLTDYPEEWSANWAYTRVLLTFRRSGAGRKADQALKHALEVNPHVPLYLLGIASPPKQFPAYYGIGDENEAIVYVTEAGEAWLAAPEALAWLAEALLRLTPPPGTPRPKQPKQPRQQKPQGRGERSRQPRT
jgi:tetratricopeptide (TPR) repeat protein